MGPKKAPNTISAKNEKKQKGAAIEDKTFGLKNKNKSKVVQAYCKTVQNQVMHGNQRGGASKLEQEEYQKKADKKSKAASDALLASLLKNAMNLGAGAGGEEATNNQHINLYSDPRNGTINMPEDTIITCIDFLKAVEDELYGWRWECPNGLKCGYRHQLPEGYVVTSKKDREKNRKEAEAAEADQTTIEESIEAERSALKHDDLTPVTKESFFAWKEKRKLAKQAAVEEELKQAEVTKTTKKGKGGKNSIMNGRALFTYNPDLFVDDENAVDNLDEIQEENKEEEAKVDNDLFAAEDVDEDEEVDFD